MTEPGRRLGLILREVEQKLAHTKVAGGPGRVLSPVVRPLDLEVVLAPIDAALTAAIGVLGAEPEPVDARQVLLGRLSIMWSELLEVAPDRLRIRYSLDDLPVEWAEAHRRLVEAVELVITRLGSEP